MNTEATPNTPETIVTESTAPNPEATEAGLASASECLQAARDDHADLEKRIAALILSAAQSKDAAEKLAWPASQGNATSAATQKKHMRDEKATREEAAALSLALPEARARIEAATAAHREAERSHIFAQAKAIFDEELMPLAERIDASVETTAALLVEREGLLVRLVQLGGMDPMERITLRTDIRRLNSVFARAPSIEILCSPTPELRRWLYDARSFSKTMAELDAPVLATIQRRLYGPTPRRPSTDDDAIGDASEDAIREEAEAEAQTDSEFYEDVVTGHRVRRFKPPVDESSRQEKAEESVAVAPSDTAPAPRIPTRGKWPSPE